jgi:hypothetical protein
MRKIIGRRLSEIDVVHGSNDQRAIALGWQHLL